MKYGGRPVEKKKNRLGLQVRVDEGKTGMQCQKPKKKSNELQNMGGGREGRDLQKRLGSQGIWSRRKFIKRYRNK